MNIKKLETLSFQKLNAELKEDLNGFIIGNDVTSTSLIKKSCEIKCIISNRDELVLCGSLFIKNFLKKKYPRIIFKSFFSEGDKIKKNSKIFFLSGNAKIILAIERTILNFLQHLCSISTITNKFVMKIKSKKTKLLDTRKTTTGLRKLEKYATKIGGAENHRFGLYDSILIKDNHIKILGGISNILELLKKKRIKDFKIEWESPSEVKQAIQMNARYILLDNMSPSQIKKCMYYKNNKIKFEITGGISLYNIHKFSALEVDYISTSKITKSTYSVDIGLDII